jgi:hypothetical protein
MTAPTFLPWLRSGLAGHLAETAVAGLAPHDSATASVAVRLAASSEDGDDRTEGVPSPPIRLRGPGAVLGVAAGEIVRCEPTPGTADVEPNYFAHIEFASADLPWRFTPAAPDRDGRLQPWLALVVVEDRPGVRLEQRGGQARPVLHVDDPGRELPDLTGSWAWAHVQADGSLDGGVAAALRTSPELFRSRLVCPRRLRPDRSWLACLVPVFEAGRRAGLGEPTGTGLGLAWSTVEGTGEVSLPVYHWWRFRTGPRGDFESLVRRLWPRELPGTVGRRDLDLAEPGEPLPAAPGLLVTYRGALVAPHGVDRPWPQRHREATEEVFRQLTRVPPRRERPAGDYRALRDDPVVGAPRYGAVQAHRRRLPAGGWLAELNTDPVHRSVAGLGAAVVRRDQEELMAAAWQHAAEQRAVNVTLSRARLGWEAGRRLRSKVDALDEADLVQLAGASLARLRDPAGGTLLRAMHRCAVPAGVVSAAMRRRCRTVAGLAPVGEVTRPSLADPATFASTWRRTRPPANADLQADDDAPATSDSAARPVVDLARRVRTALDPAAAIAAMVGTVVTGLPADRAHPVPARWWSRPRFTNPMYARLRVLAAEALLPGAGDIPDDTIGLLVTNPEFAEAFLAGVNHEIGREFRWREYPARLDDTWSRHFWDTGPGGPADITAIAQWTERSALGSHRPPASPAADLVLVVKGALPRRYPDLRAYVVEAEWTPEGTRREKPDGDVRWPVLSGSLGSDLHFYGYQLTAAAARGSRNRSDHPGYFLVLEQVPESVRFGVDEPRRRPAGRAAAGSDRAEAPQWTDAAELATGTLQRPVRMLTHASAMLPDGAR